MKSGSREGSACAFSAACNRDLAPNFRRMCWTCTFTVFTEMPSDSATSRFAIPSFSNVPITLSVSSWSSTDFPPATSRTARQLRLDLAPNGLPSDRSGPSTPTATTTAPASANGAAPCGEARSCTGCPMYGAPGHPGYRPTLALSPAQAH